MIGSDILFRHTLAFIVPCCFAGIVLLATRVTHVFWFRVSGVVLALLVFYFSAMIMNRLLFASSRGDPETGDGDDDPGGS